MYGPTLHRDQNERNSPNSQRDFSTFKCGSLSSSLLWTAWVKRWNVTGQMTRIFVIVTQAANTRMHTENEISLDYYFLFNTNARMSGIRMPYNGRRVVTSHVVCLCAGWNVRVVAVWLFPQSGSRAQLEFNVYLSFGWESTMVAVWLVATLVDIDGNIALCAARRYFVTSFEAIDLIILVFSPSPLSYYYSHYYDCSQTLLLQWKRISFGVTVWLSDADSKKQEKQWKTHSHQYGHLFNT